MTKRVMMVATVGVIAVLVAGGLFASNMGFKLTYTLQNAQNTGGNNDSLSGRNTLSLPYIPMTTLVDVLDLCQDINSVGGAGSINNIARLDPVTNALVPYDCVSNVNFFTLVPQEAYEVQMNTTVVYPIVGSHDPTYTVTLTEPSGTLPPALGGGVSQSGRNFWAYPYHSTAANAKDLCDEVNLVGGSGTVNNIAKLNPVTNALVPYDCVASTGFFSLTPGEGYTIQVNTPVTGWIPNHY